MSKVAIIGGSKEAVEVAKVLDGLVDYCLFETSNYRSSAGLNIQAYDRDTDWNQALQGFNKVVIAPHPFAFDQLTDIFTEEQEQIALTRPTWELRNGWFNAADVDRAADILRSIGATKPLLAIGRMRLKPFLQLDVNLQIRCRNKPLPNLGAAGTAVLAKGPFTVEQEQRYLLDEKIDCVVVHNAGGQGGWPKLQAAFNLAIPVILISRPTSLWTPVTDINDVIRWLGLDVPYNNP